MLPLDPQVNHIFYILANFAETQCVDPVTREMHSKQTPLSCQHKNHFCTNIQANPPPKANFRGISILPQPLPIHQRAPIAIQYATLPHCEISLRMARSKGTLQTRTYLPLNRLPLLIDAQAIISSVGEICLTSKAPLLIFRHTAK